MFSFKAVILVGCFAMACAMSIEEIRSQAEDKKPAAGKSETLSKNCTIVAKGTKSCVGAKGENCRNRKALLASAEKPVLVCSGSKDKPVNMRVELSVFRSKTATCFLSGSETRTCNELNEDTEFTKIDCNERTAILPSAAVGNVNVCIFHKSGKLLKSGKLSISAKL